ncbi:MAG: RES family NAD+ phosphorylase [Salaquimonas sp.]
MIDIDTIPVISFNQTDTIRLISTAYIDESAMAPLTDDKDELAFLEELERLTSARQSSIVLPADVHPDELLTEHHGYGWSYINAAFCYTRSTGNRFNGPNRGAWYATWGEGAVETAKAEVSWHLTRELEAVGVFDNITTYRELIASFASKMHDLRELNDESVFHPDPAIGYPSGQALGANLRAGGANGILYPSVRKQNGNCLAAFRPNLVQNVRQGATWTFEWAGKSEPNITKTV